MAALVNHRVEWRLLHSLKLYLTIKLLTFEETTKKVDAERAAHQGNHVSSKLPTMLMKSELKKFKQTEISALDVERLKNCSYSKIVRKIVGNYRKTTERPFKNISILQRYLMI